MIDGLLRKALVLCLPFLPPGLAQAASFDCAKATIKIEAMVCENAEISQLDHTLNTLYLAALQDRRQAEGLRESQRHWLKRRNRCANEPCLRKIYSARIKIIRSEMDDLALLDAASAGDLAKADELLKRGADVNVRVPFIAEYKAQPDERTPLHLAVEAGHKQIVELLLSHRADVHAKKHYGDMPLHVAVEGKGNREIVELLLAHGANPNASGYMGETPLHRTTQKAMVESLIAHGADVNARGDWGGTPLFQFAARGDIEIIQMLISKGADVFTRTKRGQSLLAWAAFNGQKQVVQFLLANGSDINSQDEQLLTPLHWSAMAGHKAVAELLVANGADIFLTTYSSEETPLQLAQKNNKGDVVRFLNAKINDASISTHAHKIEMQKTLFNAISKSDVVTLNNMLAKRGAIHTKGRYGSTLLHEAVGYGNIEMIYMLLKHGADINAINNRGWTPLHRTTHLGKADAALALLSNKPNINAKSDDGSTPLHDAISHKHFDIARLLIDHGADVNAQDISRSTPLHTAAWRGHRDIVERLFARNANINAKDIDGNTPLHKAVQGLENEMVGLLLANGADIDAVGESGTPLHILEYSYSDSYMRAERQELLEFLIAKGADVNVKDQEGLTVLQRAIGHRHEDLVKILKAYRAK